MLKGLFAECDNDSCFVIIVTGATYGAGNAHWEFMILPIHCINALSNLSVLALCLRIVSLDFSDCFSRTYMTL